MAGPFDPFTPGPAVDPTAGIADPETFNNIRNQWSSFIEQPGNRAFLLQTGLALMQPPSFGDNPASQIGRAVGAGAEAATRQQVIESKLAESESKAEANIARAGEAGARAGAAQDRLGLDYFRLQAMGAKDENKQLADAQAAFLKDKNLLAVRHKERLKAWDDANLLRTPGIGPRPPAEAPDPSFESWLQSKYGAGYAALPGVSKFLSRSRPTTPASTPVETE